MLEHHTILPGNIVHVPGRLGDRKPQDMKNRFVPGLIQLPQVTAVFITNPESDVAVVGPVGKHQVSVSIDPDRGNIPEIPFTVGDNKKFIGVQVPGINMSIFRHKYMTGDTTIGKNPGGVVIPVEIKIFRWQHRVHLAGGNIFDKIIFFPALVPGVEKKPGSVG